MFIGIVQMDDIRELMFDSHMYNSIYVRELMTLPPEFISIDEPMESVVQKFEITNAWNLPVLENGKYLGFVSKSKVFSAYRDVLVQFSDE